MMQLFEGLGETIGTELEDDVLKSVYQVMPIRNFSSDLLQRAVSRIAVIELSEMHWSDWGRAERIAQSLRRIDRKPAFVMDGLSRHAGRRDPPDADRCGIQL